MGTTAKETPPQQEPEALQKVRYAFYSAIVFLVISSPIMYRIVAAVLGGIVASPAGCPTVFGLLLHTAVFFGVIYGLMFVPFLK
jgi:hypothetical protein